MPRLPSRRPRRAGTSANSGGGGEIAARRDLREHLLASAETILRERGLAFVSLRAVARLADVSHGAPAYHFGSKAGLLTAFAAQGYRRMVVDVRAVLATAGEDARDRLQAIGCAYVRFAIAHPEAFAIMFRAELHERANPELVEASAGAIGLLGGTIALCVQQGYLPPERAETAGAAAWSLSHGLAELWLQGRLRARTTEPDLDKLSRDVHALFVRSIMPDLDPRPARTQPVRSGSRGAKGPTRATKGRSK